MKLHDLQVGHRFTFIGKHRGKMFEVASKDRFSVVYMDVATGEDRIALSNRKTFRMEVETVTENRVVEFTPEEIDTFTNALMQVYLEVDPLLKPKINVLYLKLTGLPGRRRVLPEEE